MKRKDLETLYSEVQPHLNHDLLLITGDCRIGKSTLLRRILKDSPRPGLLTYWERDANPPTLWMESSGERIRLATIENDCLQLRPDGFETDALRLLNRLLDDPSHEVYIDEIGHLECRSPHYVETLFELFRKKKVIAVVRKDRNPVFERLNELPDVRIFEVTGLPE